MPFNQIDRFEKLNEVQVHVFRIEKKGLGSLKSRNFHTILYKIYYLSEDGTHHYVLITNLKPFVNFIKNKQRTSRQNMQKLFPCL